MATLTYSQYCKNKDIKASLGWMNGQYIYKGKLYSPQEIDVMFPTKGRLVNANDRTAFKGLNNDKKKNFIHDEKAY